MISNSPLLDVHEGGDGLTQSKRVLRLVEHALTLLVRVAAGAGDGVRGLLRRALVALWYPPESANALPYVFEGVECAYQAAWCRRRCRRCS